MMMDYLSDLAAGYFDDYDDSSFPSPERQLLWRLCDLNDHMEELSVRRFYDKPGYIYTEDDIRYVLPEYIEDLSIAERAIELAKEDLLNLYGINVDEAEEKDAHLLKRKNAA